MLMPELLKLFSGQVKTYPLNERVRVRNACAYIRAFYNIKLVTRTDSEAGFITVRVKK